MTERVPEPAIEYAIIRANVLPFSRVKKTRCVYYRTRFNLTQNLVIYISFASGSSVIISAGDSRTPFATTMENVAGVVWGGDVSSRSWG